MTRYFFMLWAVVQKELRQTVRDRRMMVLLLAAPLIQLILFGHAVQLDVDRVPTVVVDLDRSQLSRTHLTRLLADGTLLERARESDPERALRMLETGEAAVALIVPAGFERDVVRRRQATVQVVLDGSDPNRANVAGSAVAAYFGKQSELLVRTQLASAQALGAGQQALGAGQQALGVGQKTLPDVQVRSRVLFNPTLETSIYMVPGVAAMLLLLITTIVSAMGLARERERGTLEQILVTPVPSSVLVLGKIIPFALIGLIDFLLALVAGAYVFDMPLRGSMALLLLATSLYLTITLATGLLISTFSSSQQQAFMGGFLFMLPAALLSGIMTPVRSMPAWLAPLTLVNPLRHYAEILRAVLLRGAEGGQLLPQLCTLAAMGLVVSTYAAVRFRRKQG
jgi:ABC-2 type transport system permease protein